MSTTPDDAFGDAIEILKQVTRAVNDPRDIQRAILLLRSHSTNARNQRTELSYELKRAHGQLDQMIATVRWAAARLEALEISLDGLDAAETRQLASENISAVLQDLDFWAEPNTHP